MTKTDGDTGKVLARATFDLYNSNDKLIKEGLTTDKNGQIKVDNLKPGNYYFKETAAPAGYDFNKDTHYGFTVELQVTTRVAAVSVKNAEKTGSVVLTKTDSDTGKTLSGAVFDLYKKDGTKIASGLTTDAAGQVKVAELKPGDYYFKETSAPAGYELNDAKLNFTVELQTTVKVATVSATNAEKTGSVVLTKTDSDTGKTLAGATFDLYKADGTKLETGLTTGNNGQIKVDNLKPGDYYFKETSAPAGYELNDTKLNFTVELQTTVKVATVSATNAEKTGSVVLTKTDSDTGKTLSGAVFDLYKKDGTKVASGLTTDAAGQINVAELKPGQYYFVETSAPAGYSFDIKKQYSFTIVLNQQHAVTVKATNTEKTGSVVLTKTDGDTGKALSGAVFDLYKKDGTKVASGLTTDVKGQVKYNNLKLGKYYFVEVKAPKGYDLNKDKQTFRITLRMTEKSIPANVQVTDKKTPVQPEKPENPTQSSSSKPRTGTSGSTINKQTGSSDKRTSKGNLPQTGEQYSGYLTVIGIVIILAVLGIILYRRRLNHKNSK
ncbi:hypothetical protein FD50_GL001191 [Liquorilactobacillus satsumensis DSM 16230 = JCM 12392]|uniref:Gram-positive cocci surface proteins LPxTG domain-containing protein n=1 Tax=Liquorilactobacillus satsumensis DSM 16230 = JCM 12392 TaxID=1423801 RepID=A0A0R1V7H9_9LACO|nr:hypothetical protein FD50_GL001191 [Liquorilactobacillus satsumensis DSM 16230 = JCM 12392]